MRTALTTSRLGDPAPLQAAPPAVTISGQVPELGSVVINELLANSQGAGPDWIELSNTTDQAIDIGGWFLSDDANDLTKYRIAAGTSIPAGGYIVFYEDKHFGNEADPGCQAAVWPEHRRRDRLSALRLGRRFDRL